jgi:hypothetical protein
VTTTVASRDEQAASPRSVQTLALDDEQEHWSRWLLRDETSVPPLLDRSAARY